MGCGASKTQKAAVKTEATNTLTPPPQQQQHNSTIAHLQNALVCQTGDPTQGLTLHKAIEQNNTTAVQALVERSADVNEKDNAGHTPLDLARANTQWDAQQALESHTVGGVRAQLVGLC
eukprot:GDKI01033383.1.p1 GENE.GDKI01033383.1~~GDKI01033383.1.p1  ORF type:complete len:119 (-),score=27.42 GDKI01033383.1:25-381(-)